ncbi:MAG: flap endonuclease-1 [Aigarchaeota archaeon]|nr:flap endonuclease-1 [Aigarchaeota archaeon]MDW8092589.1 flap endonuclease-1 [Nitrososphaerota archaeon]
MGVKLSDIVPREAVEEIELKDLRGRVIAIDCFNMLYQFITIIRGPDGRPLSDRRGRVTSHLNGLFFRTLNYLAEGMLPVYVFDGRPPELKRRTVERRTAVRAEAMEEYKRALETGDLEAMRKYSVRAASLEEYMVEGSIRLLEVMGVPYVLAPSEGEAQTAHMTRKGDAWASASQDYDSLLFGSPRLVKNLSIVGRRKLPGRREYVEVVPEVIHLERILNKLSIRREDLIEMSILIGNDYCDGVKGIGPKRAYALIREHGRVENVLHALGIELECDLEAVREAFTSPNVTENYKLGWRDVDEEGVVDLLCEEHDFSEDRVRKALEEYAARIRSSRQERRLDEWF